MDVHIDLSVIQILLKNSWENNIDVFPCDFYVLLNEDVCVCVHGQANSPLFKHIPSTTFNCLLIYLSWRPWYLYFWEVAQKYVVPRDKDDTHNESIFVKRIKQLKEHLGNKLVIV